MHHLNIQCCETNAKKKKSSEALLEMNDKNSQESRGFQTGNIAEVFWRRKIGILRVKTTFLRITGPAFWALSVVQKRSHWNPGSLNDGCQVVLGDGRQVWIQDWKFKSLKSQLLGKTKIEPFPHGSTYLILVIYS